MAGALGELQHMVAAVPISLCCVNRGSQACLASSSPTIKDLIFPLCSGEISPRKLLLKDCGGTEELPHLLCKAMSLQKRHFPARGHPTACVL